MDWVIGFFSQKSSPAAKESLKRKRSPPQPNSYHNPISLDDSHDTEEEIIEDSEDERQEELARRASGTARFTRPRLQSADRGRRQLQFEGTDQVPSVALSTSGADDEDELNTILLDHSDDEPDQAGHSYQAQANWEAQRQEYESFIERLQRDLESREDELCRFKSELDRKRKRILEGEERTQRLEHELSELAQREQHARGQLAGLVQRCEGAEDKLEKAKSLLKSRTEELTIAQAFMTTADQFSVADLVRLVEELNNDIYQASINLSEVVIDRKQAGAKNAEEAAEIDEARKTVSNRYGEELTARLVTDLSQEDPDPVLLESLIQNVFSTRCSSLIQAICPENVLLDKALRSIWEKLSFTRDPSIAKNWLAMTSAQFKTETIESESTFDLLLSLLTLAGWRMGASPEDKLHETALEKLTQIQEKALKIREVAMEGILSTELEAFRAPTKRGYNASYMQDSYDSQDIRPDDTVVCQTGLGLRFIKRVQVSSSSGPTQTLRKSEVVLKAKVLLSSTLAPPPDPVP